MTDENKNGKRRVPWKEALLIGVFAGLLNSYVVRQQEKKQAHYENIRHKIQSIDTSIPPQIRDANADGIADIVLQINNGKELLLYRTPGGEYIFGEEK